MIQLQHRWVVNAAEAKELIEQNAATVLDVRQPISWFFSHVPGAVWLGWWQFLEQMLPLFDHKRLTPNPAIAN
ncbi:rhodanese-like domain-containing protein [Coleofasciculus sp. G2-EDA-02]|uniref:rhodanese-like domain-containing protein n=1 Tax=Coleofasciculus sp. G2-EDA-02 TaxID=3069529 RepID=UPI0032FE6963